MPSVPLRVRPSVPADREWILPLVPRLHEFGPPPFRAVEEMNRAVAHGLAMVLAAPPDGAAVLVAERAADARPLGFIYLVTATDYFTGESHGHISDIIVARDGEGQGVGRALLDAGERWATEQGYRLLTLHVFEGNDHARDVYERAGYAPELTRMTKELRR